MVTNVRRYTEFSHTVTFIDHMRYLVDVVNDRTKNSVKEKRSQALPLLDRERLWDIRRAHSICKACRLINEAGSVTTRELSMGLLVKKHACLRLVNWMSDRELIERKPDPENKRVLRIWLTSQGHQLREVLEEVLLQEIDSVEGRITHNEQISPIRLVEELLNAYQSLN